MDIYDSRYFLVNKKLLISFGLWPYQSFIRKLTIRFLLTIAMCMMLVPQIFQVYFSIGNIDKLIEHVSVVVYVLISFTKLYTAIFHEKKLDILYSNISRNWGIIQDAKERQILMDYSERGRLLTLGYMAYMVAGCIAFDSLPLLPKVLNILRPMNISRPPTYILDGELFLDRNKYYLVQYTIEVMTTAISAGLMTAFDSMYAASVEHCLGLFAIIKFRLQNSTKSICTDNDVLRKNNVLRQLIQTIRLHSKILIFTDVLAATYESSFLLFVGATMILLSLECVLMLIKSDQFMQLIRYGIVLIGAIGHLFFLSWPGQKLIDHSASLFEDGYNNEWYETSIQSQKLLAFVTLRSMKPCCLTAGGIYVMNFANFAMTVKTSLSYMTVFSSLR